MKSEISEIGGSVVRWFGGSDELVSYVALGGLF